MAVKYILFIGKNMLPNTILKGSFCLVLLFMAIGCCDKGDRDDQNTGDIFVEEDDSFRGCFNETAIANDRLMSFKYLAIQRLFGYYFNLPNDSKFSLEDELSVLEIDEGKVLLYTKNKKDNAAWSSELGMIRMVPKGHQIVIDSIENEMVRMLSQQPVDEKSQMVFFTWDSKKSRRKKIVPYFKDGKSDIDYALYSYFMKNIFN